MAKSSTCAVYSWQLAGAYKFESYGNELSKEEKSFYDRLIDESNSSIDILKPSQYKIASIVSHFGLRLPEKIL